MRSWAQKGLAIIAWWLWMPVLYGLGYFISHTLFSGLSTLQTWDQSAMANFWSVSVLAWTWLMIGFIGTVVIALSKEDDSDGERGLTWVVCIAFALLACFAFFKVFTIQWDNDKDEARYYNKSTVIYTPKLERSAAPDSLARLLKGARQGNGTRCDLVGGHDVPSCVKQGTLPESGWEPRVGSLSGAEFALQRTSGDVQKVSLDTDTMAYLNPWHGQPARWSGILDGGGINVPIGGVAEWAGQGQVKQCLFKGKYRADRAFSGDRSNDLGNLLAEKFPHLRYSMEDVWGYCDGNQPIVVIPTTKQDYFKDRTIDTFGGLIILQGDHGSTKLTFKANAKRGEFPGPVYPASLVERQRDRSSWAAGRENKNRNGFGYEPADSEAQAGNVSEYLLRDRATGRLVWVTPLTLRHSSSQLFVAYSLAYADESHAGSLNQLSIYVLGNNDTRRINIDNLESNANTFLSTNIGTFKANNGVLVEFTPVDGDTWRAFGEIGGRVVYRLDISARSTIVPRLVEIDPDTGETKQVISDGSVTDPGEGEEPSGNGNTGGGTGCGAPAAQLTTGQLANCLAQLAGEFQRRTNNLGQTTK